MVRGDIFPSLFHRYATLLAIPLSLIYNEITTIMIWPRVWKQEYVTVIPKCRSPESMGDLRNISCTMLPSKVYESFVLNWLGTEVSCKRNQYGGVKGCGVGHLLVDHWDEICTNLEDARAATMLTAIDYAKAFNRLSFQHCLAAFARKGACTELIRILATFLSNRTMTVRVNNTWSDPLPVYGGVPQGSILGVLLFNVSTDDLEDQVDDQRRLAFSSDSDDPTAWAAQTGQGGDSSTFGSVPAWAAGDDQRNEEAYDDDLLLGDTSDSTGQDDPPLETRHGDLDPTAPVFYPRRLGLDPTVPAFIPPATYGLSAPGLNITDELLAALPRINPVPECVEDQYASAAPQLGVTDELIGIQHGMCDWQDFSQPEPTDWDSPPRGAQREQRLGYGGGDGSWMHQGDTDNFYYEEEHDGYRPESVSSRGEDTSQDAGGASEIFLSSTPKGTLERGRPECRGSPLRTRGPRLTARDWSYMPGRRNVRRRNLRRKILYSDEGEVTIPPEVNKKKTGLRWKTKDPRSLKYVDDNLMASKINMDSAETLAAGVRVTKAKHDLQTQNVFRRVVARAESRGMVVNKKKTQVLCVSDAQNYNARAYLIDAEGTKIESGDKLKVLGFHLDRRPSVHAHIEALKLRMRDCTWILRHLGLAGFTEEELAKVYCTVVRPVLDYCAVVYHPMLTDEQDQIAERLQAKALKNIYGYKDSYKTMREKAGITTHRARRVALCDNFATKAAANPRFGWFPLRQGRSGRHGETYQEFPARTDRLFNSPLYYFRHRLNGKPGRLTGRGIRNIGTDRRRARPMG